MKTTASLGLRPGGRWFNRAWVTFAKSSAEARSGPPTVMRSNPPAMAPKAAALRCISWNSQPAITCRDWTATWVKRSSIIRARAVSMESSGWPCRASLARTMEDVYAQRTGVSGKAARTMRSMLS